MTEAVWIAIIAAFPATIAAIAALRSGRHAKAARIQVENNHSTNLRDDLDRQQAEKLKALSLIGRGVTSNRLRISALERSLGEVQHGIGRIEDHLGIERTIPTPPPKKGKR